MLLDITVGGKNTFYDWYLESGTRYAENIGGRFDEEL